MTEDLDLPAPPPDADVVLLTEPADGVPAIVESPAALNQMISALCAGTGPVAIDAERAHGFRYSQRAYLIQLRRAGSGSFLLDPVAFGQPADLRALGEAIGDAEWIIHAASQDLPCLREIGLIPRRLFDTELAARLLGYPRVALGTMLEELFGIRLLKEHSAADWSTRPLPPSWLNYAVLDVELLIELRDRLAAGLVDAGKWEWAQEEFAWLVANADATPEPRTDPWRRTSGIHKIRTRRGLAYVAELWYARDEIAQRLDRAPGKILPDLAISDLAAQSAASSTPGQARADLRQIPPFLRRQARRFEANWLAAIDLAATLDDAALPPMHLPSDGPPQARLWAAKDPVAAARLARARESLGAKAEELALPVENLLTPDHLRRVAWEPPIPPDAESVDAALARAGARPWQRALTVDLLVAAFA